ncbi:uncharacterized protein LOC108628298 [Ceratina calcarata]|uniref:Uncharacterized protein LOC108628298 n=1 Tax=Ceratina calcarata TaxID=156304 RepID=A0AAJ7J724_9HYME|nr:uncharacterized protein LOC108628298 [Ceratina calcarata]
MLKVIIFILICGFADVHSDILEAVSDEELVDLIKTEKYVVVLFTTWDCEKCENYENWMIQLKEDLVKSMHAFVVKAIDSQLLRLYSVDKEPMLVYFRHGLPLLYDGPVNDETLPAIAMLFTENKEPAVKELTDETFEHLTQASTGATTGDWFVMFYSTDCVDCARMFARWETVGARLKQRLNVARVNKQTTGISTARRFNIQEVPEFIFFRHGKMYRYKIRKYDINSFVSFAEKGYKNVESVPVPQSSIGDPIQMIIEFLLESPWMMTLSSISTLIVIIVSTVKYQQRKKLAEKKA